MYTEKLKLDLDSIKAWVRRKPAATVVGYRGIQNNCPVANYIIDTTGTYDVSVSATLITVGGEQILPVPEPISDLIREIDCSCFTAQSAQNVYRIICNRQGVESEW